MPTKKNPLALNPLQLKTLTLLQAMARLEEYSKPGEAEGERLITSLPHAHGDHFHLGDARSPPRDATGLNNPAVWAIARAQGAGEDRFPAIGDRSPPPDSPTRPSSPTAPAPPRRHRGDAFRPRARRSGNDDGAKASARRLRYAGSGPSLRRWGTRHAPCRADAHARGRLLLAALPPAFAQGKPCSDPDYRAFDFWIGDWIAYDHDTNRVLGHDTVDPFLDGCVVLENWVGAGGFNGSSFNVYSIADGKWHQSWNDNQGGVTFLEGGTLRRQDGDGGHRAEPGRARRPRQDPHHLAGHAAGRRARDRQRSRSTAAPRHRFAHLLHAPNKLAPAGEVPSAAPNTAPDAAPTPMPARESALRQREWSPLPLKAVPGSRSRLVTGLAMEIDTRPALRAQACAGAAEPRAYSSSQGVR